MRRFKKIEEDVGAVDVVVLVVDGGKGQIGSALAHGGLPECLKKVGLDARRSLIETVQLLPMGCASTWSRFQKAFYTSTGKGIVEF